MASRPLTLLEQKPGHEKPTTITFSVALSNGHFKGELVVPFPIPEDEWKRILNQWMDTMLSGLRIGALELDAVFPKLAWTCADIEKEIRRIEKRNINTTVDGKSADWNKAVKTMADELVDAFNPPDRKKDAE